jgi:hypothetical protein
MFGGNPFFYRLTAVYFSRILGGNSFFLALTAKYFFGTHGGNSKKALSLQRE